MKKKVQTLMKEGKLTYTKWSGLNAGRNMLDLDEESFRAGCRKETGILQYRSDIMHRANAFECKWDHRKCL